MKKKIKDFIACFSLASIIICGPSLNNLADYNSNYHLDALRLVVFQLLTTILILSFLYFLLIQKALFSKKKYIRYFTYSIFSISFAFFFRALLKIISHEMKPIVYITLTFVTMLVIIALIFSFYKNSKKIIRLITISFIVFFPFSILILSKMSTGFFASKTIVQTFKNNKPKVVWIIFDEWDHYLTFENRDKKLSLSTIDNFKQNYFHASKVYQPSNSTPLSLSSYLTGKIPKGFHIMGHDKVLLDFGNKKSESWKDLPSIFSKLKNENINSAIIGWAFPYDRMYDNYLVKNKYYPNNKFIMRSLKQRYIDLFLFYFLRPLNKLTMQKYNWIKKHIIKIVKCEGSLLYEVILARAKEIITDSSINFSFIHFSIPHPPIIYDAKKQKISTKINSYIDQLQLVDKTIADIKNTLIKDGSWDNTTLILTSDHWYRQVEWDNPIFHELITVTDKEREMLKNRKETLIPLIIKMPNQKKSISYDKAFNAVALHDLVLDIYNNKVSNEKDLITWLDNLDDNSRKPNQDISCSHFLK